MSDHHSRAGATPWRGGAHRVRLVCSACGRGFERYKSAVRGRERNYCSAVCQRSDRAGAHNPKWRGGPVRLICQLCGGGFLLSRDARHATQKFCSVKCRDAAVTGVLNPRYTSHVPCQNCGKPFKRLVGTREKFCTPRCSSDSHKVYKSPAERQRAAERRRRLREEAASGHHTDAEWATLCERASGRCAGCGKRRILTRDHVTPLSLGGSDNISNIQPLCQPCNSRKGTKRTHLL